MSGMHSFGWLLAKHRLEYEWTERQVAEAASNEGAPTSEQEVVAWENNKAVPRPNQLDVLISIFIGQNDAISAEDKPRREKEMRDAAEKTAEAIEKINNKTFTLADIDDLHQFGKLFSHYRRTANLSEAAVAEQVTAVGTPLTRERIFEIQQGAPVSPREARSITHRLKILGHLDKNGAHEMEASVHHRHAAISMRRESSKMTLESALSNYYFKSDIKDGVGDERYNRLIEGVRSLLHAQSGAISPTGNEAVADLNRLPQQRVTKLFEALGDFRPGNSTRLQDIRRSRAGISYAVETVMMDHYRENTPAEQQDIPRIQQLIDDYRVAFAAHGIFHRKTGGIDGIQAA